MFSADRNQRCQTRIIQPLKDARPGKECETTDAPDIKAVPKTSHQDVIGTDNLVKWGGL